jgi:hypothetical protein
MYTVTITDLRGAPLTKLSSEKFAGLSPLIMSWFQGWPSMRGKVDVRITEGPRFIGQEHYLFYREDQREIDCGVDRPFI